MNNFYIGVGGFSWKPDDFNKHADNREHDMFIVIVVTGVTNGSAIVVMINQWCKHVY